MKCFVAIQVVIVTLHHTRVTPTSHPRHTRITGEWLLSATIVSTHLKRWKPKSTFLFIQHDNFFLFKVSDDDDDDDDDNAVDEDNDDNDDHDDDDDDDDDDDNDHDVTESLTAWTS